MENAEIENGVFISRDEYERYNQLKAFRRNTIEQFDVLNVLIFRLNVFINLLIENDDNREEIISNILMAIEELNCNCDNYKNTLNS